MIDIDSPTGPDWLTIQRRIERAGFELVRKYAHRSRTGWHAWAMVDPAPTPVEAVALQAICGSDPAREACNLARARVLPRVDQWWRERWNTFYSLPKGE